MTGRTVEHRFARVPERAATRVRKDGYLSGATLSPLTGVRPGVADILLDQLDLVGATVTDSGSSVATELEQAIAASRVVASVTASAWVQESLRVFAGVTNLSVAHTRVVVRGGDSVAVGLIRELQRIGARVLVVSDDPVLLVELSLDGFAVSDDIESAAEGAVVVFGTSERSGALDAAGLRGVGAVIVVDAALPDEARAVRSTPLTGDTASRDHLVPIVGSVRDTFLLDIASARGAGFDDTVDRISSAFALLLLAEQRAPQAPSAGSAEAFGADAIARADATLAELVLA